MSSAELENLVLSQLSITSPPDLRHMKKHSILWLIAALPLAGVAQGFNSNKPLSSRVVKTPESVLATFHEAGMSPREHQITREERAAVAAGFKELPPLHQRILKEHLSGISFLDDMPNTALTSLVVTGDSIRRYHITFRAAVLHQTISSWLTEKENTCFEQNDSNIRVAVRAGNLPAIIYILLHETTHVVDGSLGLFENPSSHFGRDFTANIWTNRTTMTFKDTLLETNHFRRGGRVYPIGVASHLYTALEKTPFVSLYSTSSWNEDLAECLTVYHLTQVLKQPFEITTTVAGETVVAFEPAKDRQARQRMNTLAFFYR
jgi:hypothetical protein